MVTTSRVVHGSGDFGGRPSRRGASLAELAEERRKIRADPLRAKVYADPTIHNPEGFLIWLGRRRGGLNSHRGRAAQPGPGTRRLAQAHGGQALAVEHTRADAPTVRLSRSTAAQLAARTPASEAETVRLHRPARDTPTVAIRRPMSSAALAARAKPGGVWTAAPKPSRPEPEKPKPIDVPPELAKLRIGNVKVAGPMKTSKRWKLGRGKSWSALKKGL
ncbi:hypothetical protein [Parafrankia sp. EUN1f]|uniref:hypothetical protein n=1 Tax=Parafrankia sp. EUN1f TaxID=102897 RepID=UPI0001C452E8|nr:hypothetical protein [Parafrankia sp. EUN1f]EFC79013.1 hypothetical protein FrEUN1fDRAFT_7864 [Parafrankia sp. EUN1f]